MTPLSKLVNRDQFPAWLEANGVKGTGVEVGTYYGLYAEQICNSWGGKLVTVDPYNWMDDPAYVDGCRIDWSSEDKRELSAEAVRAAATERLAPYERCRMLRFASVDAARMFPDGSLAFVYLDGNHSPEAIREELSIWPLKVRKGGVIAGHDCYSRDDEYQKCGVFNAVWNYSIANDIRPHVTHCTSWWIQKP